MVVGVPGTGIGPAIGSLRGKHNISFGTGAKCNPGADGSLIAYDTYERDYEICPDKGTITIYRRLRDETDQKVRAGIVAKIDGYSGQKGVTRAKREVQYLIDEPDRARDRIDSGLVPVITPEGIVMSRAIRPEAPLIAEAVPA